MKVCSVNKNYNTQPTFKSWEREIINVKKGVINRNNTYFFRDGVFFPNLTKMLSENFENIPKVNVYCFGCSDGSEPFTFAMSMLTLENELNPQKFFPIIARDIDPVAIDKAKNNDYKIFGSEKHSINRFTQGMYDRFIHQPFEDPIYESDQTQVFVKKELYDCVDFKIGDIFEDYKKVEPKNSVVLARNFWPYIDDVSRRKDLLNALYNHLDQGSYIVIGDFDQRGIKYKLEGNFSKDIEKVGFNPTEIRYVYKK